MGISRGIVATVSILGVLLLIVLVLVFSMNLGSSISGKNKVSYERVILVDKTSQNQEQVNQINQEPYVYPSFFYKSSNYKSRHHIRHDHRTRPKPKVPDNRLPINGVHD